MALFSNIPRLAGLDTFERRVFVRADLDVPLFSYGGVLDDTKLRALLPTLRSLQAKRARVVIGAHYGSPTEPGPSNAAACVARRLGQLLGQRVSLLSRDFVGELALLEPGDVALTPNLSTLPEEPANDAAFAQRLARSIDAYVNDDVVTSRLGWASVDALPRALTTRAAGHLLERDLELLESLTSASLPKPLVAIVGGDSFARKAHFLWTLLMRAEAIVLGGVVANTCLAARGWQPGQSRYEPEQLEAARAFLDAAEQHHVTVQLPVDALVLRPGAPLSSLEVRDIESVRSDEAVVDVAVRTCLGYKEVVRGAASVLWSGALGVADAPELCSGTYRVIAAIPSTVEKTVLIGGRTAALAEQLDLLDSFQVVSSSSGALSLVSGTVLPGVEALRDFE
jgi:phosphoglycerate kinase